MSRILWLSNPPWAGSGYGEQTNLFVPRLASLGHELAIACNWGLNGRRLDYRGFVCYPADNEWGNTTLSTYADDHKADLSIALCDSWVMKPQVWKPGTRLAIWSPVDHKPLPAACAAVLAHPDVFPIAMSRFGQQQMEAYGLPCVYVPHGVDTDLFKPRPEIREAVRAELGIPADAFVVGMVAANKGNPSFPRKGFPQAFAAFAQFAKHHDDAWMYVHSEANPSAGGGISLDLVAHATGCPRERLLITPEKSWQLGMSAEVVANMYAAFDVLLNPSMGEGFGIPILEAQASGVPVIASDHSAMSELTQAGWLVSGDPYWDALQSAFFIIPSIDSIRLALEAAYERADDQELRDAAVAFAQDYDADLVTVNYWEPALERLLAPWPKGREVGALNGNRKQRRAKRKVAA